MISVPYEAGSLSSAASQASYTVPVTEPVPAGAAVIVFAGAAGATSSTAVTDSQGNAYDLAADSATDEYAQAWACVGVTGLNPIAEDYWTVTFGAANTQNKNILAVAVAGCEAGDIGAQASGNSNGPTVTGTALAGNEIALACFQTASGGGVPVETGRFAEVASLSPSGQQSTSVFAALMPGAGPVTASGFTFSSAWTVLLVSLTAALPAALGNQSSPSGGVQLPPYPGLPAPRTWSAGDMLLTPWLRADPGNALTLLANPPLVIAGQTTTTQSVPNATVTTVALDTELTDPWLSHTIPDRQVYPPLEGWHLAEGQVFINDTTTGTVATAGIQVWQDGTPSSSDGAKVASNGVNFPIPVCADLVKVNPGTEDSIALYAWQNSGAAAPIASAWLKTEWVAASTGTVISTPAPAAGWTTGATTLLQEAAEGATGILVADPTGIIAGGIIALDAGNAAEESVTVTSQAGQTVGISACAYPHPAAAPVGVPVSAAWMNQQVRDKIRFLAYKPIARLTSQGGAQDITPQSWPAGTAIQWSNPATSGYRCVDNYGGWSSGSPAQYTFPYPGTWYVYGQVYFFDNSSAVLISAGLQVTGGTILWGDRVLSAGNSSDGVCATVRRTLRVGAGDYVAVCANQNSGAPMVVYNTAASHSRLVCVWRGY